MSPLEELSIGTRLLCVEAVVDAVGDDLLEVVSLGDVVTYTGPYNMSHSWLTPEGGNEYPFIAPNVAIYDHFTFAPARAT